MARDRILSMGSCFLVVATVGEDIDLRLSQEIKKISSQNRSAKI